MNNKSNAPIVITILLVIIALIAIVLFANRNKEGKVSSFAECMEAGYPVAESFPRQCTTPDGKTYVEEASEPNEENEANDLIRVTAPQANDVITSPLTVKGEARGNWYFEASFPIKLVDANGKTLAEVPAQAKGDWMTTEFVPFETRFAFSKPDTSTGTLILHNDNASGLPENDREIRIPVRFASETMTVKAFFTTDATADDCSKVTAASRTILKTQATAEAALNELLQGPTAAEQSQGYQTSINPGTRLNSISITNGVARADFNGMLDQGVAGSCRVTAIRSQIESTLRQFSTVKSVIISVNGETEEVLQP